MRRFVVSLLFLVTLFGCTQQTRPLKPFRPMPTPDQIYRNIEDEAIDATHAQLFVTPDAFLDQLIRIDGSFATIEAASCSNHKGPLLQWGLIGVNAQGSSLLMNAHGFERAVELVPEGTTFLVDGIWKRYYGALGCGKEPAAQTIYYLEVVEILQPNPIVRNGAIAADTEASFPREPGDGAEQETLVQPSGEGGVPDSYPVTSVVEVEETVLVEITVTPTTEVSAEPTRIAPPTPTPSPTRTPRPDTTPDNGVTPPDPSATPTRTPFPTSMPTETPTRTPFPTSSAGDDEATTTPTPTPADDEPLETATPTPIPEDDGTAIPTDTPDPEATETPTPDPDDEPLNTATPTPDPDDDGTPAPNETPDPGIGTTDPGEGTPLPTTDPNDSYPGAATETPIPTLTQTPESYPSPES